MISLKAGVSLAGLVPQMNVALQVAHEIYAGHDADVVVTSGMDGRHSKTSLHYSGCALDLRTRNLDNPEVQGPEIAAELKAALGIDYDVLFEGDHIHMEWQPRRRD